MKKITDYSEVSPLILKYFKKGVMTNNFLTPQDYKSEISEGRLFYENGDEFLNLYVKRDGFFIMYFYIFSVDFLFPEIDAPIVCDVPEEFVEIMENNSFKRITERIALEKPEDVGESYFKTLATEDDAAEIFSLMEKSFDKFSGFLPNLSQIRDECREGLFKVEKNSGEILGVLRTGKKGKVLVIKHLLTNEKFRGRGVAKSLVSGIKEKSTVWTGEKNTPAINLYKSMGFLRNGKKSIVYMKGIDKNDS